MNPNDSGADGARGDDGAGPITAREVRVVVFSGLVLLYIGLFLAAVSNERVTLFLGIAMAVTGALLALPQLVAAAVSRR